MVARQAADGLHLGICDGAGLQAGSAQGWVAGSKRAPPRVVRPPHLRAADGSRSSLIRCVQGVAQERLLMGKWIQRRFHEQSQKRLVVVGKAVEAVAGARAAEGLRGAQRATDRAKGLHGVGR